VQTTDCGIFQDFYKELCHEFTTPELNHRVLEQSVIEQAHVCFEGRGSHYTAARSPWQNLFVERIIGSIRRGFLDHLVAFSENHLRRILKNYYGRWFKPPSAVG
jgi:hypothetical protein